MAPGNDRFVLPAGDGGGMSGAEIAALILSAVWLVAATLFVLLRGAVPGAGGAVLTAMAVFLPMAMLWVAAIAARTARIMREEIAQLRAAIEAIRPARASQNKAQGAGGGDPSIAQKLDEIAAAQRKTETALATFSSTRAQPSAPPSPRPAPAAAPVADGSDRQAPLPLGTPADDTQPPLARADFIRALNFPETPEDKAGFGALRRALKDRPTAQLIQAAQDVLTLLSQEGIYMEDLRPDMARPEVWRSFAGGTRGRAIAALGGIRDRTSLSLASARMKNDPIFRDAAHHFLRRFDRMFSSFAEEAADSDITALSDTRTARAFMLLGRVAGTFD